MNTNPQQKTKKINLSKLFDELYPLHRTILGEEYRKSLRIFGKYFNFKYLKFKTGSKVFDWTIPEEWKIYKAYIKFKNKIILDYKDNNLSVVSYSIPINKKIDLQNLKKNLFSSKTMPGHIPYITSFYKKSWGFCIQDKIKKNLKKGNYEIFIKSSFKKGYLENGITKLKGKRKKIILLSSYLCHPSMANNELSGPLTLLGVYEKRKKWKNKNFSYYFMLNPETIGSISYLSQNYKFLKKNMKAGMVFTCLGGPNKKLSYKLSRSGKSSLDKLYTFYYKKKFNHLRNFSAMFGSDERQYCSGELNLPVGQISRTVYGQYKEYHTSADSKEFMQIKKIENSINEVERMLKINDWIFPLKRKIKYCEPKLDKINLYPSISKGVEMNENSKKIKDKNIDRLNILLTILSYADGDHDILDISNILKKDPLEIIEVLQIAIKKKLILE